MTTQPSAAELIAQAEAATTAAELDEIEAQAAGRVTVLTAIAEARDRLGLPETPAEQAAEAEAASQGIPPLPNFAPGATLPEPEAGPWAQPQASLASGALLPAPQPPQPPTLPSLADPAPLPGASA